MTTDKQSSEDGGLDEARLEALARQATGEVPADVSERLAAMRREAVQVLEDERPSSWIRQWSPVTASMAGAAFALVVALWLVLQPDEDIALPLASEPEAAIVTDMDLLEELEFIAWLEEESQGAG
jgi:hypothetical protein